jgi:hypothetical protein
MNLTYNETLASKHQDLLSFERKFKDIQFWNLPPDYARFVYASERLLSELGVRSGDIENLQLSTLTPKEICLVVNKLIVTMNKLGQRSSHVEMASM